MSTPVAVRLTDKTHLGWAVLAWVFAIACLAVHQRLAVRYLEQLDAVAAPADSASRTPIQSTTFGFAPDAQTWIRHALTLRETGTWRLRYTRDDNAPYGREIHWNSAWAWVIAGAGGVQHRLTGEATAEATARAARWVNFSALVVVIGIVGTWSLWRFNTRASAFIVMGIAASGRFYQGFAAGYVDHHGLLSACVLVLVLGAVGMLTASTPTRLPYAKAARSSAIFSAVGGAIGLWISAASTVLPIAIVGIAALVTVFVCRSGEGSPAPFDPGVWRLWGRVGGALALIFYIAEYFPAHLGWRLEVNHPVYALAWWAGAEWVALIGERAAPRQRGSTPFPAVRSVVALAGALLPAILIAVFRDHVFSLLDPFLAGLHATIAEFKSVVARANMYSVAGVCAEMDPSIVVLLVGPPLLFWRRPKLDVSVVFTLTAAAAFTGMGLWQERWLLNASGPLIVLTWVVWEALQTRSQRIGAFTTLGIFAVLLLPPVVRVFQLRHTLQSQRFSRIDGLQPLYRDVAAALRRSQPEGNIVLLASPNTSVSVGYYGQFQTIGTLYWENAAGLKAAASIFSAASADAAGKLIFERGITHIAVISEAAFIQSYYELLHPSDPVGFNRSFGYQLEVEQKIPSWLQVLPYTVPEELSSLNVRVLLFKVVPGQSVADALYSLAVAQVAWKSYDGAERTLQQLTDLVPDAPAPWVRRSEVAMARRDWPGAIAAIEKAVALAPADAKAEMYHSAGKAMLSNGQPAAAAQLLRASVAVADADQVAAELAWLLATCRDPTVRNGAEALQIAARLVNAQPRVAGRLVVLAAALAESGRFSDAVAAQTAAIQLSGSSPDALPALERELSAYRAGRAWRE